MDPQPSDPRPDVRVRPLVEADLAAADRIVRISFGTFLGLPDPMSFMGDADFVHTRWKADPSAAFAAQMSSDLVGSNFAANWGSVGFFGPLTVRPDLWDAGIGKRLMEPVMACFDRWGTRQAGLFTFAHSPKHVGLYQRFGFWPGHLIAVLSRPVVAAPAGATTLLSSLARQDRAAAVDACRKLTGAIYDGLDLGREIDAVAAQALGDTVLVRDGTDLVAFAVCHTGPGTEAGSGTCYVKFGAAMPSPNAAVHFGLLLDACDRFATERRLESLVAGVSTARREAYRALLERGFRTVLQGVAMHRRNAPGYDRPGIYVLEDWR